MFVDLNASKPISIIGKSAHKAQQEILPKIYFLSAVLWILWPILQVFYTEKDLDHWPLRVGIFIGLISIGFLAKKQNVSLVKLDWLAFFVSVVAVIYVLSIGRLNSWPNFWSIGIVLVVVGACNFFSNHIQLLLFLFFSFVFGFIATSIPIENLSPPSPSFFINYCCVLIFGMLLGLQKIKILQNYNLLSNHKDLILDNLQDGIVLHDSQGQITAINSQAPRVLGLSMDQILGKSNMDPQWKTFHIDGRICPPEEHPSSLAQKTGKKIESFPLILQKKEGDKAWLEVTAIPIFNPELSSEKPLGVLVIIRDETQIKRSIEVIDQQRVSLESAARLSALGEMAGGIAHEINNPLAIIVTQIGLLKLKNSRAGVSQIELNQSLDILQKTSERITKIISSMRALVRQNPKDSFEEFDISQVIEDIIAVTHSQFIEKNVELRLQIEPGIQMNGHKGQFGQLIINLLSNSIDAVQNLSEKWIEIRIERQGAFIHLIITDSGLGIPDEIKNKIFNPFFTTKEKGKGTGLGLSLVQSIARQHGAEFYLNSNSPNTSFVVRFPS